MFSFLKLFLILQPKFFKPKFETIKKTTPKKILIFWEIKLFSSNIKEILIFSQRKAVLVFWETETPNKSLYSRGQSFLIFEKMGNPKNYFYISGSNFPNPKK